MIVSKASQHCYDLSNTTLQVFPMELKTTIMMFIDEDIKWASCYLLAVKS